MQARNRRNLALALFALLLLLLLGVFVACSGGSETPPPSSTATPPPTSAPPASAPPPSSAAAEPDALPNGLLLAYSQFTVDGGTVTATPGPARAELLYRQGGEWHVDAIEDPDSNVFHKALVYTPPGGTPGILTLGGTRAFVKLWHHSATGWTSETLWTEDFGGHFSRMRDAEVANLYGDGPAIAVATHDQGVVATIRPQTGGGWSVTRLDQRPNTFVHEIEIGDVDHDGHLEVYATPSDPNDLDGGHQHGEVVRYVPGVEGSRTVVADLGDRHAKEIYVGDVDGDGTDELYVAVEALTSGSGADVQIVEPVEIRRYDAGTPATGGVVIATIRDRLTRFLTVGDVDGDGHREMVAASFSTGLWMLRPGRDAHGEWSIENLDRESGGFEHAALFADLDGDHHDELYVADDEHGELRRYVWDAGGHARRSVIHSRPIPRQMMTWNLTTFPVSMLR
ncbi:MAG: VCBS repeat-containing protein [Sandaracinus sp.]